MFYEMWQRFRLWMVSTADNTPLYIFLDDERRAPMKHWLVVRNPEDMIDLLLLKWNDIVAVSLDHDLGHRLTGYDVMKVIEEYAHTNNVPVPFRISVHSANPAGRQNILRAIRNLYAKGLYIFPNSNGE